jgi:2-methylcitrate dehydratase PrpD
MCDTRDANGAATDRFTMSRRHLIQTAFTGGFVGLTAAWPASLPLPAEQQGGRERAPSVTPSISRQLARWVASLRYEDLPLDVIDRAKGVTLQALASALIGSQSPASQQTMKLIASEEAVAGNGASIMVSGAKVTKAGAAFVNSELVNAGGKWDTFRMLSHPGTSIIPGAFVAAEAESASGRDFITAVAAGYEVNNRLAADWIPTVMARGFHPGIVFGIFGAATAAAKILRFTEDQIHNTLSLSVALAISGRGIREAGSARNAMLAVLLARQRGGGGGGDQAIFEGDGGFYWAYAGNNTGQLTYSFVGDTQTTLDTITANLGKDWLFLETLYRIYSTAGYNIAHVDVTAKLCEEHNIKYEDVERIEAVVNWLETQYPSPAFPSTREDLNVDPRPGSTRYYTAYGVVKRGFPLLQGQGGAADPPEVLELMKRVTLIPSHTMTLFGPRITIFTRNGKSYTKQATGREFIWDFNEEVRRISGVIPGLPIPRAQFEEIIATCGDLDRQARADRLLQLTMRQ